MRNEQRGVFPPEVQDSIEKSFFDERRPAREITLKRGNVALSVRTTGALIQELRVGKQPLLVSASTDTSRVNRPDNFLQPLKTDGTFTMLPVGSSDSGPQHGPLRYIEYDIETAGGNQLALSAKDRLRQLGHHKTFTLATDGLTVVDDVINIGTETQDISIGEHFYLPVDKTQLESVTFLDQFGDEQQVCITYPGGSGLLAQLPVSVDALRAGQPLFVALPEGFWRLRIPNVGAVSVEANIDIGDWHRPAHLLIWHRQQTNTICFEPVAGFSIDEKGYRHNNLLTIDSGETATFTSNVRLIKNER